MGRAAHVVTGECDLRVDGLRVVARLVVQHAEDVLPVFEPAVPDDPRPRAAIDAGGDPTVDDALLERPRRPVTPVLVDVPRRYPPATGGRGRVARLMVAPDVAPRRDVDRRPGRTAATCGRTCPT